MAIQLTTTGINTMLSSFLGSEDQILKLYSNDVDPKHRLQCLSFKRLVVVVMLKDL